MSTLSELLPAGSGGKQVDFIAHGAINNAQAVALKSDGKVEPIAEGSTPIQGAQTTWASASFNYGRSLTYIGNNQVLLFYPDSQNSYYGTVVLGNVSGNTITWDVQSTPVVFESAGLQFNNDYKMDSVLHESLNLTLCAYIITSSSAAMMRCFSVSGNTITVGSQHTFNAGGVQEIAVCYGEISGNARIWVNYIDRINSVDYGVADCITVNSINSISNGSQASYRSDTTSNPSIAFNKLQNMPIITYRTPTASSYGRGRVITNGTTVPPQFGNENTLVSANTTQMTIVYDNNIQQCIIAYLDNTNSNAAIRKITYVSTNQLTPETEDVFSTTGQASGINIAVNESKTIGNGQGMVVYFDVVGGNYKSFFVLYNSTGTSPYTPTLGTPVEFLQSIAYYTQVAWGGNNNYAVTYTATIGSSWGAGSSGFNFTNSGSFIGIADAAISDTATGSVTIKGGIATNASLPTLTPNSVYYLQSDGTISTSSAGTRIGKALSSTSINLEFNS